MATGLPGLTGRRPLRLHRARPGRGEIVPGRRARLRATCTRWGRSSATATGWPSTSTWTRRTRMERQHFFRCGGRAVFEVFQYSAPDQSKVGPRNSDVGGHHVSLYVEDLDAAVAYLRQQGVTVLGEPTASSGATRASVGCTSSPPGECSSSSCRIRTARRSSDQAGRRPRVRMVGSPANLDEVGRPAASERVAAYLREAILGWPHQAGRAHTPGGHRGPVGCQPPTGERSAAHAGSRGTHRARDEQGRSRASARSP